MQKMIVLFLELIEIAGQEPASQCIKVSRRLLEFRVSAWALSYIRRQEILTNLPCIPWSTCFSDAEPRNLLEHRYTR